MKMETLSIPEVIDEIIEAVDINFPAAHVPNITIDHVFNQSALSIRERLKSTEGAQAENAFYERLSKIKKVLPKQQKELAEIKDVL